MQFNTDHIDKLTLYSAVINRRLYDKKGAVWVFFMDRNFVPHFLCMYIFTFKTYVILYKFDIKSVIVYSQKVVQCTMKLLQKPHTNYYENNLKSKLKTAMFISIFCNKSSTMYNTLSTFELALQLFFFNFMCFVRETITAPGAWLSCSSPLV